MDCKNFVAGITNVIDLQHMFTKVLSSQAGWLLTVPMADGIYHTVTNHLEDLIDAIYGARMLVHFQVESQTFDIDFNHKV